MRKRIGTQKPPVIAIGLSNSIQQRKIGLQAILAATKSYQTKGSVCLLEEKRVPRKLLYVLADQRQCARAITVNGLGQRFDVLPLSPRHAVHTLQGFGFTRVRCGNVAPVLELPRQSDMGHGKVLVRCNGSLQTCLRTQRECQGTIDSLR